MIIKKNAVAKLVNRHPSAVTAYQTKSKSNKRSRPKVNRKSVNPTQRPPETTAQEAARLALDLCVVVK